MADERIRPPWWLKYVNKVMIGLNKLGVGGDNGPVVLTVTGRKTGKPRTTPVTPMTVDGERYIVAGLPGGDWAANARAAGEATINQGRRAQRVRMVEVPTETVTTVAASESRCSTANPSTQRRTLSAWATAPSSSVSGRRTTNSSPP